MSTIDKRTHDILSKYHPSPNDAVYLHKQSGQWIARHKDLEIVAVTAGMEFEPPVVLQIDLEKKIVAICVTGRFEGRKEWSIGEATTYNCQNNYYCAMAEKRAKDRVILKLLGLHGYVYSDEEIEDAKREAPQKTKVVKEEKATPKPKVESKPKENPRILELVAKLNQQMMYFKDGEKFKAWWNEDAAGERKELKALSLEAYQGVTKNMMIQSGKFMPKEEGVKNG